MKNVQEAFDQVMEIVFMSVDRWKGLLNMWFRGPPGAMRLRRRNAPPMQPLAPLNPFPFSMFAPEFPGYYRQSVRGEYQHRVQQQILSGLGLNADSYMRHNDLRDNFTHRPPDYDNRDWLR